MLESLMTEIQKAVMAPEFWAATVLIFLYSTTTHKMLVGSAVGYALSTVAWLLIYNPACAAGGFRDVLLRMFIARFVIGVIIIWLVRTLNALRVKN